MSTTHWLVLEVVLGALIVLRCRDAGWRLGGLLMAAIALGYLIGGAV